MGAKSSIEWTDASWSPIRARDPITNKIGWHCERVSTGCGTPTEGGCYAEAMNRRLGTGLAFKPSNRNVIDIFMDEEMLLAPLRWKRPRRVFVCSMTDAFADFVKDEWLDKMFAVMAQCPQHTFQVLTKRAERMLAYMTTPGRGDDINIAIDKLAGASICYDDLPLPNVWLGVSAERQQEADERIPHLLQTPAAIRFVSLEPLLGPIDLNGWRSPDCDRPEIVASAYAASASGNQLDWVIVGGESGTKARPMHPDWARSLQKQCEAAGVAYFFKQWGRYKPIDQIEGQVIEGTTGEHVVVSRDGSYRETDIANPPEHVFAFPFGKKAAGRLLDGREWNQMTEVSA